MSSPPPIEQFEGLINKQANFCESRMPLGAGIDRCDLIGEAGLVYCQALTKWNPDKAKFITYFQRALMNRFGSMLQKAHRKILWQSDFEGSDYHSPLNLLEDISTPVIHGHLTEMFYERLSRPATLFVRELFYNSQPYAEWEEQNYKTQSHKMRHKIHRVSRFLGLTKDQTVEIMIELRERLTE